MFQGPCLWHCYRIPEVLLAVLAALVVVSIVLLLKLGCRDTRPYLMLFYVPWCPHCTALLEGAWRDLERVYGTRVRKVDCEKHPHIARKHNIRSFPTIKRMGGACAYEGERTYEDLAAFLV